MAIRLPNGDVLRNLQEQVLENKQNIARHFEQQRVLEDYGIRIVATVNSPEELPNPIDYTGVYGDAYAVGAEPPYTFYIFTRPNTALGETENRWFDIGELAIAGPMGPMGPRGIQGERGESSRWLTGTSLPVGGGLRENDLFLNSTNGDVYQYLNNEWVYRANIRGSQGIPGPVGPQGEEGPQGVQGIQGPAGVPGNAFKIIGQITSPNELSTDFDNIERDNAYLYTENDVQYIYYIAGVEPNLSWERIPFQNATQIISGGEYVEIFDADTKLDKMTSTGYVRFYAVDTNGNQINKKLSTSGTTVQNSYIPQYWNKTTSDASPDTEPAGKGVLISSTPTRPFHVATKKYADDNFVKLLPQQPATHIIAQQGGSLNTRGYMVSREANVLDNTVPIRTTGGHIYLPNNPTNPHYATNKLYVDSTIEATIPKPNLFFNSDFKINQRNLYSGTNNFLFDRWRATGAVSFTQTSDYIRFTPTANYSGIGQPLQNLSQYAGKPLTASMLIGGTNEKIILGFRIKRADSTSYSVLHQETFTMSEDPTIYTVSTTLPTDWTDDDTLFFFAWNEGAIGTVDYYWAKLEEGIIATPYYHPVYLDELDKCKAYYQKVRIYGPASTDSSNKLYMAVEIMKSLASPNTATISFSSGATVKGSGLAPTPVSGYTKSSVNDNMMVISISTSATLQPDTLYYIGGTSIAAINGEIY